MCKPWDFGQRIEAEITQAHNILECEMVYVTWSKEMLERFKIAYEKARTDRVKSFSFDGKDFLPEYAKYLIQYLEARLK